MRHQLLTLLGCLALSAVASAQPLEFVQNDGTVYRVSERQLTGVSSPEAIEKFQARREYALGLLARRLHDSRLVVVACSARRAGRWVRGRTCPDISSLRRRLVENTLERTDDFLHKNAAKFVVADHHGIQLGFGGGYAVGVLRWGSALGGWLVFHWGVPLEKGDRPPTFKITADLESFGHAVPHVVSAGFGLRLLYFLGSEGFQADSGYSFYPAIIPGTQTTSRTLAIGKTIGFFFSPIPFNAWMNLKLRRSPSLNIAPLIRTSGAVCGLLLAGMRRVSRRPEEAQSVVDEPNSTLGGVSEESSGYTP